MSFAPVYDDRSRALILGTWPSPKSREMAFYYGHPQNRFWPLLAALTAADKCQPSEIHVASVISFLDRRRENNYNAT